MSKFGKVFRELLDGAVPRDDALFLVLRNGNPYSIQLSDTYQKLFKDLKDEYKISSMAYHDSGEYSRTAHDHDCYTKTVNHFIQPGGFPVGDGCTKIMDVYTSKMYEASMDSMYIPSYADRYDELLT